MRSRITFDEDLVRRLPLPVAQLYRRAHNAKSVLERHSSAYYLWEASLKLLGACAVVEYADLDNQDPQINERLKTLARPAVGHWWEFVRRLLPILAEHGDSQFAEARDLLLGRARNDFPLAAALDTDLREALGHETGARGTVRLSELFDRLVRYRNQEIGHGAAGQRSADFYAKMGTALLAGAAEIFGRLDVLVGRQLLYVDDVRRLGSGAWLIERVELLGETARRLESVEVSEGETASLPRPERLYLHQKLTDVQASPQMAFSQSICSLHPLLLFEPAMGRVYFLNARRGARNADYLCYATGEVAQRAELGSERRELLARVLGTSVDENAIDEWAAKSQSEEPVAQWEGHVPHSRTIGEFELVSRIGRGGMGVVYRAWQPSLGRQVALKCLLRNGDAKAEARFAREIRSLGRVEHPNLVKIYTSGTDDDQWFYAMELVEGADLGSVCREFAGKSAGDLTDEHWREAVSSAVIRNRAVEQSLSEDSERNRATQTAVASAVKTISIPGGRAYVQRAVELVRQVAEAAHALHEQRIIHRDIKPGNIMLAPDGASAVLMDLGLAQLADEAEGRLTHTRQFVGTLRYASPEQVLAAGKIDRRSDVYSLGATLWELLTLSALFGATEQTPTPELMKRIQVADAERPSKFNPRVPNDLDVIVLKCLEKDETRRYHTAQELADDLSRFQRGEPVLAHAPTLRYMLVKYVRRHAAAVSVAASVAVALLVAVALAFLIVNRERLTAVSEWRRAETEAARADENASKADELRRQADRSRVDAENARDLAREESRRFVRNNYFLQMLLAQRDWEINQTYTLIDRLDQTRPENTAGEDLRGLEWHYWNRLCNSEVKTLKGHKSWVDMVLFSQDGKRLATSSLDGTAKIWDADSGDLLMTLRHGGLVHSIAYRPDGRQLASAGTGGAIRVWDLASGKPTQTLNGHAGLVHSVAFSPDGREIVSGGSDKTVRLWETSTGRQRILIREHTDEVICVAFAPEGNRFASGSDDGTVRIWETNSGRSIHTLSGHQGRVRALAFKPDGKQVVSCGHDGTVRIWDALSGRQIGLARHEKWALAVAFSSDGKCIASASEDQTARVWDASSLRPLAVFKGHRGPVYSVAFHPRAQRIATAGFDRTIRVWNLANSPECLKMSGRGGPVTSLALSRDGIQIATANADSTLRVCNAITGRQTLVLPAQIPNDFGPSQAVCFKRDGSRIASTGRDHAIRLWDPRTGTQTKRISGYFGELNAVAFNPDGSRLAAGGSQGKVWILDVMTGRILLTLSSRTQIRRIAFSPDGSRLAVAGADRSVGLWSVPVWNATSGQLLLRLAAHTQPVFGVAFSPDGKWLATGAQDWTVRIWDVATGRENHCFKGHTAGVYDVAFSPNGKRVASAGADGLVKVWDVQTGQEAITFKGHTGPAFAVAFFDDGQRIVSASGTSDDSNASGDYSDVRVWDTREMTPDLHAEREAVYYLNSLFDRKLRKAQVAERVRADLTITDAFRRTALQLLDSYHDEPITGPYQFVSIAARIIGDIPAVSRCDACGVVSMLLKASLEPAN